MDIPRIHAISGKHKAFSEGVVNPYTYCGEFYDVNSNMYYLRNRYYNPRIGRFTSTDPVKDGNNWYVYCGNNPVNFVDPFGLVPTLLEAAAMASHIYNYNENDSFFDRIVKVDDEYTSWRLIDTLNGTDDLKMGIYAKTDRFHSWENPLEYAIVNKGTTITSTNDWKNNIQHFLDSSSNDLWESVAHAKYFVDNHNKYEITFIGHSKGGAEATVNALWTDRRAIVFNPSKAEISMKLVDNGKITSYIVQGEILNELLGEPYVGNVVYLKEQPYGSFGNHLMYAINKALNER